MTSTAVELYKRPETVRISFHLNMKKTGTDNFGFQIKELTSPLPHFLQNNHFVMERSTFSKQLVGQNLDIELG